MSEDFINKLANLLKCSNNSTVTKKCTDKINNQETKALFQCSSKQTSSKCDASDREIENLLKKSRSEGETDFDMVTKYLCNEYEKIKIAITKKIQMQTNTTKMTLIMTEITAIKTT